MVEVEKNNYASKGVAGTGLGLGIAGTALSLLGGGLGIGALTGRGNHGGGASVVVDGDSMPVSRYELKLQQELAEKDAQIALRDANTYGDQKMLELYRYIDGQLKEVRGELGAQAVFNERTRGSFDLVRQDIGCVKQELTQMIESEADKRCCGDNSIVTYLNATFYPKQVADVETGTGTTAQSLYNPLPSCGSCCKNN